MQNRMVVLLCNVKPVETRGTVNQAVLMCATSQDKLEILDPPSGTVPGDRVTFQEFPGTTTSWLYPEWIISFTVTELLNQTVMIAQRSAASADREQTLFPNLTAGFSELLWLDVSKSL